VNTDACGDGGVPKDIAERIARLSVAQRDALDRILSSGPTSSADLNLAERAQPRTQVERELVRIWGDVLRVDQVGIHDSFFALGGDSISSLQISARAAAIGLRLTSRQVLEAETVARLASVTAVAADVPAIADDVPTGRTVLTPIQRWFFEQDLPDSHHWDQAVFVDVRQPADYGLLRAALRVVVAHHDVLRSRFGARDGKWWQEVAAEAGEPPLDLVDLSGLDGDARRARLHTATVEAQARIDLAAGPLVSVVLFRSGAGQLDQLLIAVHHLVVDGVSMRVLVEDLETAYIDLRAGRQVRLPDKTVSFRSWSGHLERYAKSADVLGQLDYWCSVPRTELATLPLIDVRSKAGIAENTVSRARTVAGFVPEDMVTLLTRDVLPIPGTQLRDILLAAFLMAWQKVTGREALQLDIEGHGREPLGSSVDVTRTVGWFTAMYPVTLHLPADTHPVAAVRSVSRQLDAVPENGLGYGLLRYLSCDGDALAGLPESQLSFNYLGWFNHGGPDALLGPPLQVPGPMHSGGAPRRHLIEVVITGVQNQLRTEIIYAGTLFADADMQALMSAFVGAIRQVIDGYRAGSPPEHAYRNFPMMRVDARAMSAIARQVASVAERKRKP
jgi:non-ribosomal peptide synthase protein (TIGR01720 family)